MCSWTWEWCFFKALTAIEQKHNRNLQPDRYITLNFTNAQAFITLVFKGLGTPVLVSSLWGACFSWFEMPLPGHAGLAGVLHLGAFKVLHLF